MAPSASPKKKAASVTPASQEKKKAAAAKQEPAGTGADIRNFVSLMSDGVVRYKLTGSSRRALMA
jgi:hypothetical protein